MKSKSFKTHYDPYCYDGTSGPEGGGEYYTVEYEKYMCGSNVNQDNDILISNNWDKVDCKRCLKQKENIDKNVKENEDEINKHYGDMAEHMMREELKEQLKDVIRSRDFYRDRVDMFEVWMRKNMDILPEDKIKELCNILANGKINSIGDGKYGM